MQRKIKKSSGTLNGHKQDRTAEGLGRGGREGGLYFILQRFKSPIMAVIVNAQVLINSRKCNDFRQSTAKMLFKKKKILKTQKQERRERNLQVYSFMFPSRMKIQAIVVLVACVTLATFASESCCFSGPLAKAKRQLGGKVWE